MSQLKNWTTKTRLCIYPVYVLHVDQLSFQWIFYLGIEFREDLRSGVLNSRCFYNLEKREIKYQYGLDTCNRWKDDPRPRNQKNTRPLC